MAPAVFYPERGASTDAAVAVCAGCPVQDECLGYAMRANERGGVWGARSARERRALRRTQRRLANAVDEGQARGEIATGRPSKVLPGATLSALGITAPTVSRSRAIRDTFTDEDIDRPNIAAAVVEATAMAG
jgi:WhiB family redox-sensing transcriptional regulator